MRRVALRRSVALRSDYCQRGPVAITRELLASRAIQFRLRVYWRAVPRHGALMLVWCTLRVVLIGSS
jgi:hypothetical protein